MAALTTTTALRMKLFIDSKSRRVLFAEAGMDVVDFLFSLLHLPLATAVSLVGASIGSAGSLSTSAKHEARFRPSAYAPPAAAKDPTLLGPPAANLFLMPASSFEPSRTFFRCKRNYCGHGGAGIYIKDCRLYMTDVIGTRCPNCGNPMRSTLQHVSSAVGPPAAKSSAHSRSRPTSSSSPSPSSSSSSEPSRIYFRCEHQYTACKRGGCNLFMADVRGTACPNCDNPMTDALHYVSPVWSGHFDPTATEKPQSSSGGGGGSVPDQEAATATYTVGDDLGITRNDPTSAISTVMKLRRMGVTDIEALEERTVRIGYIQGLRILKALMHSKTVLTDVFVGKVGA